jgi:uncharacterized protein involved in response to NO
MFPVWRLGHALWLAPHRPFFLLAGLWAALTPLVWLLPPGLGPEPLSWHRHELLFGMAGAAVGGYLLTALPAWTCSGPVRPAVTRLLVGIWLAGRLSYAVAPSAVVTAAVGACYFFALAGFLVTNALRAKAWRRMPLAVAPLLPGGFALLSAPDFGLHDQYGSMRMLVLFYGLLISLIGGRLVAAFTIHWAERNQPDIHPTDRRWMSQGAVLPLIAAMALLHVDAVELAAALLVLSGILQLARMVAWRSWRTVGYPALLLLHLAWVWLPLGLIIVAISFLPSGGIDPATGLHALTMGAMGTMMFAIMSRAAMPRCYAGLSLPWDLALAFVLVFVSVPVRLSLPFAAPSSQTSMLQLSAMLWSSGWILFLWGFRRALRGPVARPVLSASTSALLLGETGRSGFSA